MARILEAPEKREVLWSALTSLRFPTARHVTPIKPATRRRIPIDRNLLFGTLFALCAARVKRKFNSTVMN